MAFTRAKVHWAKMDAEKLMTEGPPKVKEHCRPENYYDSVLKGSRALYEGCNHPCKSALYEVHCTKSALYEGCNL